MIKFEKAKGFGNRDVQLPIRATKDSNGYDFVSNEDIVIPSFLDAIKTNELINNGSQPALKDIKGLKPVLVSTGVTATFPKDVVLLILNRSSNPIKRGLVLSNSVGDIDSGYYPNEIKGMFYNFSNHDYVIHKGDKIMQGIFQQFLLTDNDQADGKRNGGFGSTGD